MMPYFVLILSYSLHLVLLSNLMGAESSWKVDSLQEKSLSIENIHHSSQDWTEMEELLDFQKWKERRFKRDYDPMLLVKERVAKLDPFMAKVMVFKGDAFLDRGEEGRVKISHYTSFFQGDELYTTENSVVYLLMYDGTIIRVSPKTRLTFLEYLINSNGQEVYALSLSQGHIYMRARVSEGKFLLTEGEETDLGLIQRIVMDDVKRADFARNALKSSEETLKEYFLAQDDLGAKAQHHMLNHFLSKNSQTQGPSKYLISFPYGVIELERPHLQLFTVLGAKARLKLYQNVVHFESKQNFNLNAQWHRQEISPESSSFLKDIKSEALALDKWLELKQSQISEKLPESRNYKIIEYFVTRIPSIHLLAEKIFSTWDKTFIQLEKEEALKKGRLVWSDESFERRQKNMIDFLTKVRALSLYRSQSMTFLESTFDQTYINSSIRSHMGQLDSARPLSYDL